MARVSRSLPRAAACLLAVLPAGAQTVLRVGTGQPFAQIHQATAVAAPGDAIEVSAGYYQPFGLTVGATLRAVLGAIVVVQPTAPGTTTTRFAIPAGQRARICGLTFANPSSTSTQPSQFVLVDVGDGVVSFENCAMAGYGGVAALTVFRGNVTLRACTLVHGANALLARFARVAAVQCGFLSDDAAQINSVANMAISLDNSQLQMTGCNAHGGNGSPVFPYPANGSGIALVGASDAWLEGSSITGGDVFPGSPAPGAIGLRNDGTGLVRHRRCPIAGGLGGGTFGQAPAITGQALAIPVLGIAASPAGLVLGTSYAVTVAAEPQAPTILLATFGLSTPVQDPVIDAWHWGLGPQAIAFANFTIADAAGHTTLTGAVPNSPALRDIGVWFTALSGPSLPLDVSPPVGGVVR
jgi:hypothetical protein